MSNSSSYSTFLFLSSSGLLLVYSWPVVVGMALELPLMHAPPNFDAMLLPNATSVQASEMHAAVMVATLRRAVRQCEYEDSDEDSDENSEE